MRKQITGLVLTTLFVSFLMTGMVAAQGKSPLAGIPRMSMEPNGPEMQKMPAGTDTVYLVFDYETEAPVEIAIEIRSEAQQGAVIFSNRETYTGSGTANIEIPGPGGAFPDGVYNTIIRFRREGDPGAFNITAGWEWTVGDVELPPEDPNRAQPVPLNPQPQVDVAQTGGVSGNPGSGTTIAQNIQATSPPQATPGISPAILAGVGVIVLILLGVIAWAVRGFMTAS